MAPTKSSLRAIALSATLKRCPLFNALDGDSLMAIAETCALRSLEKGEYLFHEGDTSEGFYVVQTGAINVHRNTPDGKEQVIRIFRPFSSFAEIALASAARFPVNAVAVQSSQVVLIQRASLRALIQHNPDIAFHIISSMTNHFRHLVHLLEDQKFKDIESRLANWLLREAPETPMGEPIVVELDTSKKLLANQLGVAGETLSRTLARFREAEWIHVDGPRIEILDPEALKTLVELYE